MIDKISFAILTLNEEKNIKNAIESIPTEAYENTFILDGGSKDNTENIAKKFDINFISLPNTSIERRRHEAVKISNSEYICFLDADQSLSTNTDFESIFSIFERNKTLAGVQFNCLLRSESNSYWANGFKLRYELTNKAIKNNKRVIGTPCIFKRLLIKDIAYQNNIKGPCDDTMACLRIRKQGYKLMTIDNIAYENARSNFRETINKALWYGRGDFEYVQKLKDGYDIRNHIFHVFIRNLILIPLQFLFSKNFKYIFFFLIFGISRVLGFLDGMINNIDLTSHKS